MVDLAILVDNVLTLRSSPLRVWAPAPVLEAVRRHLINNPVWPDFTRLPAPDSPALEPIPLSGGGDTEIAGLTVRWVQVNHTVFTAGYCLTRESKSFLYSGDTAATDKLWTMGEAVPDSRRPLSRRLFPIVWRSSPQPAVI